ncbi:hypothetical protein BRETT_002123 [Brettanomyces bruxellensis]|uniref:Copper transport protein n=2 Tax=Dekkera bruxellensis TaxID=5007 RepID=A0A871R7W2_DEKBR|nr:uncharacterized protein BRETT_002123 [Brettanomyces bruxellensis]QOU21959.1 hypothetical protein BRETT_002123 [Brettanomyces bruxellensis]
MNSMSGMSDMISSTSSSMNMASMISSSVASASTSTVASATSHDPSIPTYTGGSMDDMMDMDMNTYLVTDYSDYPVIFKNLKASSKAAAFGIFCVLFFAAFVFRGLAFLNAYLEQRVFHNYTNAVIVQNDPCACDPDSELDQKGDDNAVSTVGGTHKSFGRILKELFMPGMREWKKDLVRLIIAFVSAMIGYGLMLAAMSFVVLYFFAICLGLAFSEVFFNRLGIAMGINRAASSHASLH